MLMVLLASATEPATYRAGLADPSGWVEIDRKKTDVGEVVVSHKTIADQECLAAETTTTSSPERLLALAADIEGQPAWSSWKVPASVKLSSGTGGFDYYQVLDNPVPVADRYWFLHATTDGTSFRWEPIDPQTYPAALAAVKERFPGAVPTRVNVGEWNIRKEGSSTSVRYRICTDAGGNLPRWVGEFAARTTLPTNVADLVRRALKTP